MFLSLSLLRTLLLLSAAHYSNILTSGNSMGNDLAFSNSEPVKVEETAVFWPAAAPGE